MVFRSFLRLEGLIRELLDDEPRDVPFKVSGIRLSKKKPPGIKWRCSFFFSLSHSSSCIFRGQLARTYVSLRYAGNSQRNWKLTNYEGYHNFLDDEPHSLFVEYWR